MIRIPKSFDEVGGLTLNDWLVLLTWVGATVFFVAIDFRLRKKKAFVAKLDALPGPSDLSWEPRGGPGKAPSRNDLIKLRAEFGPVFAVRIDPNQPRYVVVADGPLAREVTPTRNFLDPLSAAAP